MAPSKLPPRKAVAVIVTAVATLQFFMVLAFAWPAAKTDPRDLPVVVTGPSAAVTAFTQQVEHAHPGALDVTRVRSVEAAEAAIEDRDAYGAVLLEPTGPRLLVASAASPPVAQLLTGIGQAANSGQPVPVTDVVPTTADDPRGAVVSAGLLPIVMTSVIAGALLALLVGSAALRTWGIVALSTIAGVAVVALGHGALGGLDGNVVAEAGVVALLVAAVSATVAGAGALFGHAGIPPMAILMMLLGNPLSGASTAPEMLPQGWGAFGQLLPPGAGSQAMRSVGFFDGAAVAGPLAVLFTWAAVGFLMMAVAAPARREAGTTTPAPDRSSVEPAPLAG